MGRKVVAQVIGIAAAVAMAWGLRGILATATCTPGPETDCPAVDPDTALIVFTVAFAVSFVPAFMARQAMIWTFVGPAAGLVWVGAESDGALGTALLWSGVGALLFVVLLFGGMVLAARARAARMNRLVTQGKSGIATVLTVQDTGVTVNEQPRVALTVRIEPTDGSPAFTATKRMLVSRVAFPMPGGRYPAWWLPGKPDDFGIATQYTDAAPDHVKQLFAQAGQTQQAPPNGAVPPHVRVGAGEPGTPAGDGDPLDRLVTLDQLRRSGALTDAEFETQKQRLLRDMP